VLIETERILVVALHDERPVERLAELVAAAGDALDADERERLSRDRARRLPVASLVVRRLRLDRVLGGDIRMRQWCDADPAGFGRPTAATPPPSRRRRSSRARRRGEFWQFFQRDAGRSRQADVGPAT